MPYIKLVDKVKLEYLTSEIKNTTIENPGQLNFLITKLIHRYMECTQSNYQAFNDVLGALSGASSEFYRRKVVPYENNKIEENGDV